MRNRIVQVFQTLALVAISSSMIAQSDFGYVPIDDGIVTNHGTEKIEKIYEVRHDHYADGSLRAEYRVYGDKVYVDKYYPDGGVKETGMYLFGLPHGKWQHFDANGQLLMAGRFKDGLRTGKWIYHTEDGIVHMDLRYRNGEMVDGKRYDDSGDVVEVISPKD